MEPKVMISGSRGFVGKRVAKLFKNVAEYDIAIDRTHSISNKYAISKFLKKENPDIVIHLAANPHVQTSYTDPHFDLELNTSGTLNMLECCHDHGIDHFIFSSTAYVYGEPQYMPIDINHPTNPTSPYGISKLASELYCKFYEKQGLPVTILRFFNIYGDGQPYGYVIPDITKRIRETKGSRFEMRGSPEDVRDFLIVEDLADCIRQVVRKRPIGKILNVGGGKNYTILEVANMISKILKNPKTFYYPKQSSVKKISRLHADITQTTKLLDWKPKTSLEEGLKQVVPKY